MTGCASQRQAGASSPEPVGAVPERSGAKPAATADTGTVSGCACCSPAPSSTRGCCCCCGGGCDRCPAAWATAAGSALAAQEPIAGWSRRCWCCGCCCWPEGTGAAHAGACCCCCGVWNCCCCACWKGSTSPCPGTGRMLITRCASGLHTSSRKREGVEASVRLSCMLTSSLPLESPRPRNQPGQTGWQAHTRRRAGRPHPGLKMLMPPCSSLRMACSWCIVACTSWCNCRRQGGQEGARQEVDSVHSSVATAGDTSSRSVRAGRALGRSPRAGEWGRT